MTVDPSKQKAAAIRYEKGKDRAPRVVAKGRGDIARRIIEVARQNNVPVYEDQRLVEVLETLDVDMEIPAELYRAVAEVLVFIYRLNRAYDHHKPL